MNILLYVLSIVGSGAGFVTQMLVSGFWSSAYGNDVWYFSLGTAFYFLFLGVGSLTTARWKRPVLSSIFLITIASVLWTGLSMSLLKLGIRHFENQLFIPIAVVCVSGFFSGQIIPLVLKVAGERSSINLSMLFFLDYSSAIVFSLLFTFVLLVPKGYALTSVLLSYLCLGVIAILVFLGRERKPSIYVLLAFAAVAPYSMLRLSTVEKPSHVVHQEQSHYQKIVLIEERQSNPMFPNLPQHTLFLDGFVQFNSATEQNYHACLANVPVAAAEFIGHPVRHALILGGGDGLVARNLLGIPKIEKITLVELDPAMIRLAKNELRVRIYNFDSLRNEKVSVIVQDAFQWVRHADTTYDLVVVDFPAPKNISLARLFSAEFYSDVFRLLKPDGMLAIQAGPSFLVEDRSLMTLSKVTACIKRTLASIGHKGHVYINQRDSEAFILSSANQKFDARAFFAKTGMLAEKKNVNHLCIHSPSWKEPAVEVNTLNTLPLATYMSDWFKSTEGTYFRYAGSGGVFLPD